MGQFAASRKFKFRHIIVRHRKQLHNTGLILSETLVVIDTKKYVRGLAAVRYEDGTVLRSLLRSGGILIELPTREGRNGH